MKFLRGTFDILYETPCMILGFRQTQDDKSYDKRKFQGSNFNEYYYLCLKISIAKHFPMFTLLETINRVVLERVNWSILNQAYQVKH